MIPKRRKDQVGGVQNKHSKKLDARDLAEAVVIFKQFDEKWSDKVIKVKRWMEKKKLLDDFIKTARSPKLQNARHMHIIAMMKKLLKN